MTFGKTNDLQVFPRATKKLASETCEFLKAGDERIELPPKVLETPIIPLDQSPTTNSLKW